MKLDDIVDAIGDIKPEYIKEAEFEREKEIRFAWGRLSGWRLVSFAAACFVLLAGGVMTLRHFDSASGITEDGAMAGSAAESAAENLIAVNEISDITTVIFDVPKPDHIVFVNAAELEDYFKIRLFPAGLPEGITYTGGEERIYPLAYNKEEQMIADNNCLEFSDKTGERCFKVSGRTVLAGEIVELEHDRLEKSYIGGTEVVIGHTEKTESYIAMYEKNEVHVTVQAENLTEDELIFVLEGLLE